MQGATVVLDRDDMRRTLVRIAHEIVEKNPDPGRQPASRRQGASGGQEAFRDQEASRAQEAPRAQDAFRDQEASRAPEAFRAQEAFRDQEASRARDASRAAAYGPIALVGIHRRGAILAQRLHVLTGELLETEVPLGYVDISFYRDDLAIRPSAPIVHATQLDFPIDSRTIVIVDDVLYTGRTVRAAIDEIFDYGRPARVQLATLIDRGHRELPIRPDYVGKNLPTSQDQRVNVCVEEIDGEDAVTIGPANEPRRAAA